MLLRGGYYPSFGKPHDGLGFGPEMMTPRPRLDRHRRHRLLRRRPFPAGVPRHPLHRQRRHQPHQPRHARVARLDAARRSSSPTSSSATTPGSARWTSSSARTARSTSPTSTTASSATTKCRSTIPAATASGAASGASSIAARTASRSPARSPTWPRPTIKELVDDLAHPNLTLRMLATNQLLERDKDQVREAAEAVIEAGNPLQRVHGLWVLERLGRLDDKVLARLARDQERWSASMLCGCCRNGTKLNDGRAEAALGRPARMAMRFVQRAAADAAGPATRPPPTSGRLLDLRQAMPGQDAFLLHTVRMALRNQLRDRARPGPSCPTSSVKQTARPSPTWRPACRPPRPPIS